ncbi:probable 3-hydroxyisobutyryl-CoA hydrolase 3 [Arachis ipaensis]|uniref:probable 3-hydroxyisobutyryl-CoA hydrolase 3 n=1 Tax=Arachis ipaensis TaxID=130454 RepID=UPI000A2AF46B|nr:probable 3-hydroxyisobutyryl-CoA hydrolase 3 [Arachis ipaensis]
MAMTLNFNYDTENQVLFTGNSSVRYVILNRPGKLNTLNHVMVSQILKNLRLYENDFSIKLVILKVKNANTIFVFTSVDMDIYIRIK